MLGQPKCLKGLSAHTASNITCAWSQPFQQLSVVSSVDFGNEFYI